MNDRIRELDVFLRVTEETSFSAAARSLDCNPSTVSKLIQRMEDRLGVRLFHRTSRVLKLTHEGERFLEGAHRVIDALEEAESGLAQSRLEASSVLRINCPLLLAQYQISPLIPEFLERHPKMWVEFVLTAAPIDMPGLSAVAGRCATGTTTSRSMSRATSAATRRSCCAPSQSTGSASCDRPTSTSDRTSNPVASCVCWRGSNRRCSLSYRQRRLD